MGTMDSAFRARVGLIALAEAFVSRRFSGWMVWAAAAVSGIMLVTAVVGICPMYRLLGINTCRI
jgi:Protein of unknown function (DUF2892)